MHCPFCQCVDTRVIDSRVSDDGGSIRRRRECEQCGERFNTFETAEVKLPNVVKSDGRREPFDEAKLRTGFRRALQKRPVESERVDAAV
ncbi:MAG: transcriptional repressor NrdR, partial [Burkholderiaceae bacterium]|nr:transcriptional repressor NrdR [Burkholderiaceae bacterium]